MKFFNFLVKIVENLIVMKFLAKIAIRDKHLKLSPEDFAIGPGGGSLLDDSNAKQEKQNRPL